SPWVCSLLSKALFTTSSTTKVGLLCASPLVLLSLFPLQPPVIDQKEAPTPTSFSHSFSNHPPHLQHVYFTSHPSIAHEFSSLTSSSSSSSSSISSSSMQSTLFHFNYLPFLSTPPSSFTVITSMQGQLITSPGPGTTLPFVLTLLSFYLSQEALQAVFNPLMVKLTFETKELKENEKEKEKERDVHAWLTHQVKIT
ncbi:hypothetical protein HMI56_006614, partial [Coelomomyces lativittatus]